ncbi:hypothetical protein TNCV_134951 [Trichonephila clavipes]|nr:hypothetical protein TNCV_134951 [Trichonephila clavipes]
MEHIELQLVSAYDAQYSNAGAIGDGPKSNHGQETRTPELAPPLRVSTRGLLATDHVILNHGQVTWMTPELAPSLLPHHTNGRTFQLWTDLVCIAALHGGS